MNGWMGKLLVVDLASGEISTQPLDMEMARLFIGGRGLGARLLWDLVGPEVEPLSPENVPIIATGPATATASDQQRLGHNQVPADRTVLTRTRGTWACVAAGYDALIVKGAPPHLAEIMPDTTLKDASHLWA